VALRTPIARHATLAAASVGTLSFNAAATKFGTVHIKNLGPGAVSVKFDGFPVVAPADDQFTLDPGDSYNTDNVVFSFLGVRSVAACEVQAIAYIAAGGDVR
jgi:hypothetical protein